MTSPIIALAVFISGVFAITTALRADDRREGLALFTLWLGIAQITTAAAIVIVAILGEMK
jgi:hypothetical protein